MIQVIDRLFQILRVLSKREKAGLAAIAAEVGLAKSTTGNILKTLVDLGYLGKNELSEYFFAKPFYELVEANIQRDVLIRVAEKRAGALAGAVKETVVVAALRDLHYYVIAEATYDQTVTVNATVYQSRPLYRSVTGRVLLAFSDPDESQKVRRLNTPAQDDWPEVATEAQLSAALESIRREGFAELRREQVYAVARPVHGAGDELVCALGVYMPISRLTEESHRGIGAAVEDAAEQMSAELKEKAKTIGGCHGFE
jgi:DNA-binding IclR family transcriptional regulator